MDNEKVAARPLDTGMGVAVARRTVFRPDDQEDWGRVADRVARGSLSLVDDRRLDTAAEEAELRNAIASGALLTSGRHLQHGDAGQFRRNMELHTNCATGVVSSPKFYLLLNGSGVGASYDDELRLVDWGAGAPELAVVLSARHRDFPRTRADLYQFGRDFDLLPWLPDGVDWRGRAKMRLLTLDEFDAAWEGTVRDWLLENIGSSDIACGFLDIDLPDSLWAKDEATGAWTAPKVERLYGHHVDRGHTVYHRVADSREGWAKALELYEAMAYAGAADKRLILDFSDVRPLGAPIGGMQDRPASGPLSIMRAFINVRNKVVPAARSRDPLGVEWDLWEQAMHVDHHFSVEVQVGGARRAARMATKNWRDRGIFRFIRIKSENGLWTSNNSVMVDREFWERVQYAKTYIAWGNNQVDGLDPLTKHAYQVFFEATRCAHINGEPGFINGDLLEDHRTGFAREKPVYADGEDFGSKKFRASFIKDLLRDIATRCMTAIFPVIVNPCVTADTWILTDKGARQVKDLIGVPFVAFVDGERHQATGFWKTGDKSVVTVKTARGYEVRCTHDHKILVERSRKPIYKNVGGKTVFCGYDAPREWVEAGALLPGDRVVLNDTGAALIDQGGEAFDRGWLVGSVVGDGGYNVESTYQAYARFWGEYAEEMAGRAAEVVRGLPVGYHQPVAFAGPVRSKANGWWQVETRSLSDFVDGLIESGSKTPSAKLEAMDWDFVAGFLRGLFDADGSVQGNVTKGRSVRLAQSNLATLKTVQRMLARYGVLSTIHEDRRTQQERMMPAGDGSLKLYVCKAQHELVITRESIGKFASAVGFYDPDKAAALDALLAANTRGEYADHFVSEVTEVVDTGEVEAVYDCTVDAIHRFDANGIIVHNCGEIPIHVTGGYCVLSASAWALACPTDLAGAGFTPVARTLDPAALALWDHLAERSVRLSARFLIRVNLMDALYGKEVARTNRIGVGFTGFWEWAWARFGYTFRDVIDEAKSADLWALVARFSRAAKDAANAYADELGLARPHTVTTVPPGGSISKLFGLCEGGHLPPHRHYLRWVQFKGQKRPDGGWVEGADPLLADYGAKGYPLKELRSFQGMTAVGFPTVPLIARLMPESLIVTAPEATPAEQYQYLRLLEKHWLGERQGAQVSYTLKVYTDQVDLEAYRAIVLENQPTVRCCSVMPSKPDHEMGYEYLPEEEVSAERFAAIVAAITDPELRQEIDLNALQCASGACPI